MKKKLLLGALFLAFLSVVVYVRLGAQRPPLEGNSPRPAPAAAVPARPSESAAAPEPGGSPAKGASTSGSTAELRDRVVRVYRRFMDHERATEGEYSGEEFCAFRDELLACLGPEPLRTLLALIPDVAEDDVAALMVGSVWALADGKEAIRILGYAGTIGRVPEIPAGLHLLKEDVEGPLAAILLQDRTREKMRERILQGLSARLPFSKARYDRDVGVFLRDGSESVRAAALGAMTGAERSLDSSRRADLLQMARSALLSGGEALRESAARSLRIDPSNAAALLDAVVREPSIRVRAALLDSAGGLAGAPRSGLAADLHDRLVRTLVAAGRDGDDEAVHSAIQAVGAAAGARTAREVYEMLTARLPKGDDWEIGRLALGSLRDLAAQGHFRSEIRTLLQKHADNPELPDEIRRAAVNHLATLGK